MPWMKPNNRRWGSVTHGATKSEMHSKYGMNTIDTKLVQIRFSNLNRVP